MSVKPGLEWLVEDTLYASTEQRPDATALIVDDVAHDYATLLDQASRLARGLQELGLEPGGRVVIQMANSFEAAVAVYGTTLAGGVFVVVSPQLKTDKLGFILADSDAEFLITQDSLRNIFLSSSEAFRALKHAIVAGNDTSLPSPCVRLGEIIAASDPTPARLGIPIDLAALIYTSGSTGTPKGVMMRHESMVFTMQSLCRYLRLSQDDRLLNFLPLAFDYGLYQLLMSVRLGATLILERSFTFPLEIVARATASRATVFPGVPTAFATLQALQRDTPDLQLPDVTCVTNTAAALAPALVKDLHRLFPSARIYSMYGLTECKRVSYLEPELLDEKPTSVGRAIPGTEATVLVDGRPAAPGEIGVLHVRGRHVMAGYWKQPELTATMLRDGPTPGERLLCTQDFFRQDEDGLLYFVGRSDDIIKSGGQKVSPIEIENALRAIDGVREAVVVGVAHDLLGEAIRAYVVLHPGASVTEREVIRFCRQNMEPLLVPQEVVFVDALPTTDSGKIKRTGLGDTRRADDAR